MSRRVRRADGVIGVDPGVHPVARRSSARGGRSSAATTSWSERRVSRRRLTRETFRSEYTIPASATPRQPPRWRPCARCPRSPSRPIPRRSRRRRGCARRSAAARGCSSSGTMRSRSGSGATRSASSRWSRRARRPTAPTCSITTRRRAVEPLPRHRGGGRAARHALPDRRQWRRARATPLGQRAARLDVRRRGAVRRDARGPSAGDGGVRLGLAGRRRPAVRHPARRVHAARRARASRARWARSIAQLPAPPDYIFHSTSSGGTQAGLRGRLQAARPRDARRRHQRRRDRGGDPADGRRDPRRASARMLGSTAPASRPRAPSRRTTGSSATGTASRRDASREAQTLLARTRGADRGSLPTRRRRWPGLIGWIREGRIAADATVLFWHTGGQVGVFAL